MKVTLLLIYVRLVWSYFIDEKRLCIELVHNVTKKILFFPSIIKCVRALNFTLWMLVTLFKNNVFSKLA